MTNKVYIVTGADGHLGSTVIRLLKKQPCSIRGLIQPESECNSLSSEHNSLQLVYYTGDVRNQESLKPLFGGLEDCEVFVIHTAGIVDISEYVSRQMYEVNVEGTKNMVRLSMQHHVKCFLYVSSVHAIPEENHLCVMEEIQSFSQEYVTGGYAKTKAEATKFVLASVKNGLNAIVVHPSGIIGPYDTKGNHLVQLLENYAAGKLPACVRGGYDFVDVRDVAAGCLLAIEKGHGGHCYILSNRHYEIKDILSIAGEYAQKKKIPTIPMWMAKLSAPLISSVSRLKNVRPLYTRYSLSTLGSNDRFSHDKATSELGYHPRDIRKTIKDTVKYYAQIKEHSFSGKHLYQ